MLRAKKALLFVFIFLNIASAFFVGTVASEQMNEKQDFAFLIGLLIIGIFAIVQYVVIIPAISKFYKSIKTNK